ncbi:MAG TPA: hypothetical protein VK668_18075 [Mucilaginibacter sp.]|nr:hypothetical protein [Mucilaginibacter sp.]
MKKNILPVIALVLMSVFARAQSAGKTSISFGPELSIPFNTASGDYGSMKDYYQHGLGGNFKIELPLTTALFFIGSAGYVYYATNTHYYYSADIAASSPIPMGSPEPPPYKFIPVKAGLQYYYTKCLYVSGEAGDAINLNKASKNSFIYSVGLGAVIPFNVHNGLDIGVRYERGFKITDYPYAMSQVGIRLAYRYQF